MLRVSLFDEKKKKKILKKRRKFFESIKKRDGLRELIIFFIVKCNG